MGDREKVLVSGWGALIAVATIFLFIRGEELFPVPDDLSMAFTTVGIIGAIGLGLLIAFGSFLDRRE